MQDFESDQTLETARLQLQETVMDDFFLAFCANQVTRGPQQASGNHIYNHFRSSDDLISYRLGVELNPEQTDWSPKSIRIRKRIHHEDSFEQSDYFLKFPGKCVLYRCGIFDYDLLDISDEHADIIIGRTINWDTDSIGITELELVNKELTEKSWPYINL